MVVTLIANARGDVPVTFNVEADGVHVAWAGAPLHARLTEPVKPPSGFSCRLYCAGWPAVIIAEVEPAVTAASEKSVPAPASAIICGLPVTSSEIASEALRMPAGDGLNFTLIIQAPPAATGDDETQLSVSTKSPLEAT
jgi:hypothetical protein